MSLEVFWWSSVTTSVLTKPRHLSNSSPQWPLHADTQFFDYHTGLVNTFQERLLGDLAGQAAGTDWDDNENFLGGEWAVEDVTAPSRVEVDLPQHEAQPQRQVYMPTSNDSIRTFGTEAYPRVAQNPQSDTEEDDEANPDPDTEATQLRIEQLERQLAEARLERQLADARNQQRGNQPTATSPGGGGPV